MKRRVRTAGLLTAMLVITALVAAVPVSAQPPAWGSEGWYVYEPIGIQAAAIPLRMSTDDLSDELWAGKTLADLAIESGVPLRVLRNAVDAEYFRWEHGFVCGDPCSGASVTLPIAAKCRAQTQPCTWGPCEKPAPCDGAPAPVKKFYRVTAGGGLRMRYGPGTAYGIYAVAPYGAVVEATGNVQHIGWIDWMEMYYNGRRVWAASTYLAPV